MEAGPRGNDGPRPGATGHRDTSQELPEQPGRSRAPEDDDTPAPADADDTPYDESYGELRPQRKLRLSQFAPIVVLSLLGSLMFAFPLAFAFDEAGAVVAMLGLLIGCSGAGWGVVAARRAGYTWPGLPPRGSACRPDWRMLALYGAVLAALVVLAVWRVAALR